MNDNKWKSLISGTDIRGVALGESITLTSETAAKISYGFIVWLAARQHKNIAELKVSVGMDCRISGPALKNAVISSILASGCSVLDCGMATTPAMFFSTYYDETACDGAIMITASHLPPDRNGLKFFTSEGGLDQQELVDILDTISDSEPARKVAGSI
ncbi:MAG TPA: phosphomannomutase/phosphoglucomutase, partial [Clostridia bacterium]|nr:phosphomannomutase/phosphoglucomutase [Clostridia bacterium]